MNISKQRKKPEKKTAYFGWPLYQTPEREWKEKKKTEEKKKTLKNWVMELIFNCKDFFLSFSKHFLFRFYTNAL